MAFNKETGMWTGFIYVLTNKIEGKQYIGQTVTTPEKRWKEHKTKMNKGHSIYLYSAMKKYGIENFTVAEIYSTTNKDRKSLVKHLNEKEIEYIEKYSTYIPNGYNMTKGGDSRPSGFGETISPVSMYDLECRHIKDFESIAEASRITGISCSDISSRCSGQGRMAGNFIWKYKNDPPPTEKILSSTNRIKQFDLSGNLIKVWKSMDEAAMASGDINNVIYIRRCARGNIKSHNNYVWRLYDDDYNKYRTPSDPHPNSKKVLQFSLEGKLLATFSSAIEAGITVFGIKNTQINAACNGVVKTYRGFVWRHENDSFEKYDISLAKESLSRIGRKILQYNRNGELLNEFNNAREASETTNIKRTTILSALSKNQIAFDYVWKYAS